jgi:hypothetical protein
LTVRFASISKKKCFVFDIVAITTTHGSPRQMPGWQEAKASRQHCECTVMPTGRMFGRITQKGPNKKVSGRTHYRPNKGRILPERAAKGTEF